MIPLKTPQEIHIMQQGGQLLHQIKQRLAAAAKPGITSSKLDRLANKLITEIGGQSSFKTVPGYDYTTCINVNHGVVHGIPNKTPLKKGDIVTIDIGYFYQNFHTDTAITLGLGKIGPEKEKFLQAGQKALQNAIKVAKPGNYLGHISQIIEQNIKKAGYSPVTDLTGHGIGRQLHQPPNIPCYLRTKIKNTPRLKPGITLAIEVIYTQGSPKLILANDGWTISTRDGKIAAVFEQTVAVTENGPLVLT